MRFPVLYFLIGGVVAACGGCNNSAVTPIANSLGPSNRAANPAPTPYLVQDLFVTTESSVTPMIVLEPPHGKLKTVSRSFFYNTLIIGTTVNASGDLFARIDLSSHCGTLQAACVAEFAPPYTKGPVAIIASELSTTSCVINACVAVDDKNNLYVLSGNGYREANVNEYAPPYSGAPTAVLTSGKHELIFQQSGIFAYRSHLFDMLELCKRKRAKFPTCKRDAMATHVNEYPSPIAWGKQVAELGVDGIDGCQNLCYPTDAAFDRSGDLFVAWDPCGESSCGSLVAEWLPPYKGKPKAVITKGVFQSSSIALNSKGDLFVKNGFAGSPQDITEYAPPYKGKPIVISKGIGSANYVPSIVVDDADNLFAAIHGPVGGSSSSVGGILEYEPPYTGKPILITANLSGSFNPLYFTLGPKSVPR